jgi:hypothetical protein
MHVCGSRPAGERREIEVHGEGLGGWIIDLASDMEWFASAGEVPLHHNQSTPLSSSYLAQACICCTIPRLQSCVMQMSSPALAHSGACQKPRRGAASREMAHWCSWVSRLPCARRCNPGHARLWTLLLIHFFQGRPCIMYAHPAQERLANASCEVGGDWCGLDKRML